MATKTICDGAGCNAELKLEFPPDEVQRHRAVGIPPKGWASIHIADGHFERDVPSGYVGGTRRGETEKRTYRRTVRALLCPNCMEPLRAKFKPETFEEGSDAHDEVPFDGGYLLGPA